MMWRTGFVALLLLVSAAGTSLRAHAGMQLRKNPIRKVVTMLQDMQKSVEEEGKTEAELFDKFMCYCTTEGGNLKKSIEESTAKVDELTSTVADQAAMKSQLDQEIAGHKADRAEAEKETKESSSLREKEVADFTSSSGEMKSNIQAMTGALEALKKGVGASMLQTSSLGEALREVVSRNPYVEANERNSVLAFLQGGDEMEGSSDQIIGVISQMIDETKAALAEATSSEAERKANFDALSDAKATEIKAATTAIEEKMQRSGAAAVAGVEAKAELNDIEKSLVADKEMSASLGQECAMRSKEYDAASKSRSEEQTALSETVKILNDDDALELFKKTAGAASFLQTSARVTARARSHAAFKLRSKVHSHAHRGRRSRARLVSAKGFEKVVSMVDGMIHILKDEQASDEQKKDSCVAEQNKAEGTKKDLTNEIAGLESSIEEKSDEVASITAEIETTKTSIAALDKSVAEATEQRKEEHAAFVSNLQANNAAIDLLKMAENRLNKFYNPSSYKEPAPEEEFLQAPAQADSAPQDGIFFAQTRSRALARYKKGQESGGAFALLHQISQDVALSMQEEKHDDEEAQKDYEKAMNEAAAKRAADSQVIVTREVEKAELTSELEDLKAKASEKKQLLALCNQKIGDLHKFCDYLLETFAERKAAREAEVESDAASKQVLAGAGDEAEEEAKA